MILRHRGIVNGKSVIAGSRSNRMKGQSSLRATNLKELPSLGVTLRVRAWLRLVTGDFSCWLIAYSEGVDIGGELPCHFLGYRRAV